METNNDTQTLRRQLVLAKKRADGARMVCAEALIRDARLAETIDALTKLLDSIEASTPLVCMHVVHTGTVRCYLEHIAYDDAEIEAKHEAQVIQAIERNREGA